jgi:hypothetical protein
MFSPNLSDAGIPSQSPFLGGLSQGADTYTQLLNAFAAPQMMKLQQQKMQEALKTQQLQNQFYPQETQSKIDLQNMQSQWGPVKAAASVQNALNNTTNQAIQQQRVNAYTKLRTIQNMSPAQKAVWMADPKNQAEYQSLWDTSNLGGNVNLPPNVLTQDFLTSSGLNPQYSSQQQQMQAPEAMGLPPQGNNPGSQNQLSPAQMQALQGQVSQPAAAQLGITAQQDGQQVPRGTQQQLNPAAQNMLTPPQDQYWVDQQNGQPQIIVGKPTAPYTTDQRMLLQNMIQANKAASSPQMQARLNAAVGLSNFMYSPEMQDALVTMSKYSGLLGKSESYIQSKLNPEEYAKFQAAKETIPTLVGGGVKYLEGIQTSNLGMEQSRAFIDLSQNQKAWKNDPDATLKDWMERYKLAEAESRSIADAAQPLYKVFKFPDQQPQGLVNALSNKSKNSLQTAPIQNIGGSKAIQGSDGKWYTRKDGKLIEIEGAQ